jgi:hypothetical protein
MPSSDFAHPEVRSKAEPRRTHGATAAMVAVALTPVAAHAAEPTHAALIAAAKQAHVRDVDYGQELCDGDMTVEAWLKSIVGDNARITWKAGKCELVNTHNGIDAADWPYCVQAVMTLIHPTAKNDRPEIEIYLEKPDHGRPGKAYAFRSVMLAKDGGDYERDRDGFAGDWAGRFPLAANASQCADN